MIDLKEMIRIHLDLYNAGMREGMKIGRKKALEQAAKHIENIALDAEMAIPEWDYFKHQDLGDLAEEVRTLEEKQL